MQVYQLYCGTTIFKSFVRPKPSLVLTYLSNDTDLCMEGWLYDKNGKKPVKNLVGFPVDATDPQFEMLQDATVASINIDPFSFQLLNISNDLYDNIMIEIRVHSALAIVIRPALDNGKVIWELFVSGEANPPFTHLYPVPLPSLLPTSFNPSPPKELAQ